MSDCLQRLVAGIVEQIVNRLPVREQEQDQPGWVRFPAEDPRQKLWLSIIGQLQFFTGSP